MTTTATVEALMAATEAPALPAGRSRLVRRHGWPLAVLFVGYPLWWILGVAELMTLAMSVAMSVELARQRHIRIPSGLGVWLLFLAWVAFGVLAVQSDAPHAVSGGSGTRYLTWSLRLMWYLEATVVLLYVGNLWDRLRSDRVMRIFSWMFVTIVAGGLLGVLAPHVQLRSPMEILLPHGLVANPFLNSKIHPSLADEHNYLGVISYRASAPFAYANEWGLNFACFLPFFVRSWFARGAGWRKPAGAGILALAVIPVVYSLNRGLWAVLILAAVFVAVRYAAQGNIRPITIAAGGVAVVAVLVAVTPLGQVVEGRFAGHNSNEGRANLQALSVGSVAQGSPVIGFGTTRNPQGTFYSIAGGSTPNCPYCSPPAFGTQGQLWLVVFATGVVGLLLFLGFFLRQLAASYRLRSADAIAMLTVLVAFFITLPVYDLSITALMAVMTAVGLLWRERERAGPGSAGATLEGVGRFVGDQRRVIASLIVAGVVLSLGWQLYRGPAAAATAYVLLPNDPTNADGTAALSLDTEAHYVSTRPVAEALGSVLNRTVDPARTGVEITATPNTRILRLTYRAVNGETAKRAADAAASGFIAERQARLAASHARTLSSLRSQIAATARAAGEVEARIEALPPVVNSQATVLELWQLRAFQYQAFTAAEHLNHQVEDIKNAGDDGGIVVQPAAVHPQRNRWSQTLGSGAALGLLVGVVVARARQGRGRRLRNARRAAALTQLPLLHEVLPARDDSGAVVLDARQRAAIKVIAATFDPDAALAVGGDPSLCVVASQVDQVLQERGSRREAAVATPHRRSAVLLVSPRTRTTAVAELRARTEAAGTPVEGLVFVRLAHRRLAHTFPKGESGAGDLAYPEVTSRKGTLWTARRQAN